MQIRWWIGLGITLYVPITLGQTFPAVVFSEVMWAGSDLSTADEWVEITANEPMSLSGWTVTRLREGEEDVMIRFGEIIMGSGQIIVVSNDEATESRLMIEPSLTTKDMVLANTKLLLRLRDPEGNLIDSSDDGVGEPFAGSNSAPKSSMERVSLTSSGGIKENWQTAFTSVGFDSGANLLGTPGSPNGSVNYEQENDTEIQLESFKTIKINELLSDPIGSDTEGEWIEITNTGSGTLNIGGLLLQVGEGGTFVFPEIFLGSGEYLAWERPVTGLSLRNAGDIVRLRSGETLIDSIEYGELPEGVSYGRLGESFQPFCIPTKGIPNQVILPDPEIHIQSGETHMVGKVTINLEATVGSGSLASATCSWDYADGYTSSSCNPPSHTFRDVGTYTVQLSFTDYCINTVERMLEIEVLETGVYQEPSYNIGSEGAGCTPSSSTGILITDFLPNPTGADRGVDPTSLSEGCEGELCGVGEWIELKNTNLNPANLCGWVLDDIEGGSKAFGLDTYTIEPGGSLKFTINETKIALNNDGDSVRLFFNGTLIQEITYGEIPEGKTYKDMRQDEGGQTSPPPWGEGQGEGVKKTFTGTILINELYPAPLPDEEEWIELFNPSNIPIDISELVLDDRIEAGSKPWTIPDSTMVPPEGYIVFRKEQTKLALNNDGDEVNLINSDGSIVDTVTYPKLKRGLSFSRMGSRWCETEISTPLHKNVCDYSLSLGERVRERGSKKSILFSEEKPIIEGIKSNSRSNNMFNISSLPLGGRARERGWIVPLRTIYKHVLPHTFSLSPEITSPFLADVLSMANDQQRVMVSPEPVLSYAEGNHGTLRRAQGDTFESLLVSLSLFCGLWFVFGGLKI